MSNGDTTTPGFAILPVETICNDPTSRLRYLNGRLQQAFRVERWGHEGRVSCSFEWRDVPSVSLADATPNQNSRSEG